MKIRCACVLVLCAVALHEAAACLWDRDTLAMEVARFPGTAWVMTGQFPRHSREFYEWRVKTTQEALAKDPQQLSLYDDLSVAQHKLGDHRAAINTMLRKDKLKPDLYETCSNIGTFYIYTGELNTAVNWIHKALMIKPDAHFGREKYQKWLVQWIIERQEQARPEDETQYHRSAPTGFARFVALKQAKTPPSRDPAAEIPFTEAQRNESIVGVLGMMRFADFDNPLLQEALGDLLVTGNMDQNASQLAALAYLHASRKTGNADDQLRLRAKGGRAMATADARKDTSFGTQLDNGLAQGAILAAAIRTDELAWIAAGKDASAEFEEKYIKK